MSRVTAVLRPLYGKILKFGAVGVIGVASDILATNLVWAFTGLNVTLGGLVGTLFSAIVGYVGSRYWVFRDRPADQRRRELQRYVLIVVSGLVIENLPLFVSSQLLGFHGALADNIAKFCFGLVLGGVFRFTMFNLFVFPEDRPLDQGRGQPSDTAASNGTRTSLTGV